MTVSEKEDFFLEDETTEIAEPTYEIHIPETILKDDTEIIPELARITPLFPVHQSSTANVANDSSLLANHFIHHNWRRRNGNTVY